jgi:hypothetical protein
MALAVFLLCALSPLCAHAEERDPAEIGHALAILGIIATLFLSCFSLSVWLLVMRLRDRSKRDPGVPATAPAPAVQRPDLERLWFPAATTKKKAG